MAKQRINSKQFGTTYSTTEQLTGDVWVDGKPIYVIAAQSSSLSTLGTALGTLPTFDSIVELKVMTRHSSDGGWRAVPWLFNTTANPDWYGGVYITSSRSLAVQAGTQLSASNRALAIVRYTK